MKRKNEEMQSELSDLRQLYDFLRLRPEHEALEILRRIRTNPPDMSPSRRVQEVTEFARQGDTVEPPYSPLTNQHADFGHPLTLPPLRIALDPRGSDSIHLPLPSMLSLGPEGPASQRRRHNSEATVSTR
jgi:hypothetical protein